MFPINVAYHSHTFLWHLRTVFSMSMGWYRIPLIIRNLSHPGNRPRTGHRDDLEGQDKIEFMCISRYQIIHISVYFQITENWWCRKQYLYNIGFP